MNTVIFSVAVVPFSADVIDNNLHSVAVSDPDVTTLRFSPSLRIVSHMEKAHSFIPVSMAKSETLEHLEELRSTIHEAVDAAFDNALEKKDG